MANTKKFINKTKKFTNMEALTLEILLGFLSKIIDHKTVKDSKHAPQVEKQRIIGDDNALLFGGKRVKDIWRCYDFDRRINPVKECMHRWRH